jgi:hypothetical protein
LKEVIEKEMSVASPVIIDERGQDISSMHPDELILLIPAATTNDAQAKNSPKT